MPHVIIKLKAGRSEELKNKLAQELTQAVMSAIGVAETSVSVAIEDVQANDWVEQVYKQDILPKLDMLHKKPGYDPLK